MREVERINKSVLTADSIEAGKGWSLAQKDNPVLCSYCKSPLFYIGIVWGVTEESNLLGIKVLGKDRPFQYSLREIGLNLYCAECGHFNDNYYKYFYPEDKVVCTWSDEELDIAEAEEIKYCLEQFNRKGDFTALFHNREMDYLKKKLREYEGRNENQRRLKKRKK
mgnify:FL=1